MPRRHEDHERISILLAMWCTALLALAGCDGTPAAVDDDDGDDDSGDDDDAGDDDAADDDAADDDSGDDDSGDDDADDDDADDDSGDDDTVDPCAGLPRGLCWVRTNPMFISGLTVSMGPPDPADVTEYYDSFHANATHLWETGLPTEMDGWISAGHPDHRWLSWVHHDGTSWVNGAVIGGYPAGAPGRIGYQIGDEPSTFQELYDMEIGVNAVRAADPDALVFVNFGNPVNDADLIPMLQYYGTSMDGDVVSHDSYGCNYGAYENLEVHRDVALQYDLPYWRYLRSYEQVGESDWPHESDLRWHAFIGLLYGYTGHSWFVYQIDVSHQMVPAFFDSGSWSSPSNVRFTQAAQINLEMAHLGRAITQLTSTDVRYIPSFNIYPPDETTDWSPGAGGDPYLTDIEAINVPALHWQDIAVGFFEDDAGEIYVMIQNVNHECGSFPVDNDNNATIRLSFDFGSAPPALDQGALQMLSKETGVVGSLSLVPAGPDQALLEVTLAAGDPLLFKYDTGATFALQ